MGVNSLPKTVTRRRRDCDLNPGPSAPESSMLTTRLPSHPASWQTKDVTAVDSRITDLQRAVDVGLFTGWRRARDCCTWTQLVKTTTFPAGARTWWIMLLNVLCSVCIYRHGISTWITEYWPVSLWNLKLQEQLHYCATHFDDAAATLSVSCNWLTSIGPTSVDAQKSDSSSHMNEWIFYSSIH